MARNTDTKGAIARTGITAFWLTDAINAKCFGTDAVERDAEDESVAWFPGNVGLFFGDGVLRVIHRGGIHGDRCVERRFDGDGNRQAPTFS